VRSALVDENEASLGRRPGDCVLEIDGRRRDATLSSDRAGTGDGGARRPSGDGVQFRRLRVPGIVIDIDIDVGFGLDRHGQDIAAGHHGDLVGLRESGGGPPR
jgi:hypothetical protein